MPVFTGSFANNISCGNFVTFFKKSVTCHVFRSSKFVKLVNLSVNNTKSL